MLTVTFGEWKSGRPDWVLPLEPSPDLQDNSSEPSLYGIEACWRCRVQSSGVGHPLQPTLSIGRTEASKTRASLGKFQHAKQLMHVNVF